MLLSLCLRGYLEDNPPYSGSVADVNLICRAITRKLAQALMRTNEQRTGM